MSKRKILPLEDPPIPTSSDEDSNTSYGGYESDSDSASQENIPNPTVNKTPVNPPVSDSDSGSGSGSDSEMEEEESPKQVPLRTSRPATKQRLWSEEDEITLLQGMIDFYTDTRTSPYDNINGFFDSIKKDFEFRLSKTQFVDKIRGLKKKFRNQGPFSKAHDVKSMGLAKLVWGVGEFAYEDDVVQPSNGKGKKSDGKVVVTAPEKGDVSESDSGSEMEVEEPPKQVALPPPVLKSELKRPTRSTATKWEESKSKKPAVSKLIFADESGVKSANGKAKRSEKKYVKPIEEEEEKSVFVHARADPEPSTVGGHHDWLCETSSFVVQSIAGYGLDEAFVKHKWNLAPMEGKRKLAEKFKLLRAQEIEYVRLKAEFLHQVNPMVYK